MSTGSPDARGLVAPEARDALDSLEGTLSVEAIGYLPSRRADRDLAVVEAELERLAAEVERLRGALEEISGARLDVRLTEEHAAHDLRRRMHGIARAALAGDTGEAAA